MRWVLWFTLLIFVCGMTAAARPSSAAEPIAKVCPAGHVQKCRDEIARLRAAVEWHRQRGVARWPGDGAAAIILACHTRAESPRRCGEARAVAACESHGDPHAKNRTSTASGLFQFLDSTWHRQGYPAFSVFDPYLNALAALRIRDRDGSWRQWECKP